MLTSSNQYANKFKLKLILNSNVIFIKTRGENTSIINNRESKWLIPNICSTVKKSYKFIYPWRDCKLFLRMRKPK